MAKRRMGLIAALLCICLLPFYASAASTTDAKVPVSPNADCALTISYCYEDTAFADLPVRLYKIAEVSENYQYTLLPAYTASGVVLNGIETQREWNVVLATLESYILAGDLQEDKTAVTNETGKVSFTGLETGLYLVSGVAVSQGEPLCAFDATLVSLPGLNGNGVWEYDVSISAKPAILQPDQELYYQVIKLWKQDAAADRPQSIAVTIFRNGESYETVTLSRENQWSYTWLAKDDGTSWTVAEQNVPDGYVMTLEQKDTTFVITNTGSAPPSDTPTTGDSSNVLLYIILMILSGSLLIVLGVTGKRKR